MKNIDIVAVVNAYTNLKTERAKARGNGTDVHELKLPASVAWKRRVNLDKLFSAKKVIDEALQEIQQTYSDDKHSTANEDGTRTVKPEFLPDFAKEQGDILMQETEVDICKVSIESLGDIEISDDEMDTLSFMIKEGE